MNLGSVKQTANEKLQELVAQYDAATSGFDFLKDFFSNKEKIDVSDLEAALKEAKENTPDFTNKAKLIINALRYYKNNYWRVDNLAKLNEDKVKQMFEWCEKNRVRKLKPIHIDIQCDDTEAKSIPKVLWDGLMVAERLDICSKSFSTEFLIQGLHTLNGSPLRILKFKPYPGLPIIQQMLRFPFERLELTFAFRDGNSLEIIESNDKQLEELLVFLETRDHSVKVLRLGGNSFSEEKFSSFKKRAAKLGIDIGGNLSVITSFSRDRHDLLTKKYSELEVLEKSFESEQKIDLNHLDAKCDQLIKDLQDIKFNDRADASYRIFKLKKEIVKKMAEQSSNFEDLNKIILKIKDLTKCDGKNIKEIKNLIISVFHHFYSLVKNKSELDSALLKLRNNLGVLKIERDFYKKLEVDLIEKDIQKAKKFSDFEAIIDCISSLWGRIDLKECRLDIVFMGCLKGYRDGKFKHLDQAVQVKVENQLIILLDELIDQISERSEPTTDLEKMLEELKNEVAERMKIQFHYFKERLVERLKRSAEEKENTVNSTAEMIGTKILEATSLPQISKLLDQFLLVYKPGFWSGIVGDKNSKLTSALLEAKEYTQRQKYKDMFRDEVYPLVVKAPEVKQDVSSLKGDSSPAGQNDTPVNVFNMPLQNMRGPIEFPHTLSLSIPSSGTELSSFKAKEIEEGAAATKPSVTARLQ